MAEKPENNSAGPRRIVWPWFVVGAVLLATIPAAFWMKKEINRAKLLRQYNSTVDSTATNSPGTNSVR
jgi:hypothetical protein